MKAASSVADKSVSGHSEAEWKSLEQHMKVHICTTYMLKLYVIIMVCFSPYFSSEFNLQKQLHDKATDFNQTHERLTIYMAKMWFVNTYIRIIFIYRLQHCERDVRQKRTFIENLRSRLRTEKYNQAEWEDTKVLQIL